MDDEVIMLILDQELAKYTDIKLNDVFYFSSLLRSRLVMK